jgi:chemotaxis protein histidine kinase CheA
MSDDGMIEEFKIEAAELFEEAENNLLNLDKGQDFLSNYNGIFRAFHSLKGAAGMFGIMNLQEHMHKLESLFEAQKKIASMNNKQIDYFLSGIDVAKKLLNGEDANFYHIEISDFNEIEKDASTVVKPTPTKLVPKIDRKKGVIFAVSPDSDCASNIAKILEAHEYAAYSFKNVDEAVASFDTLNPEVIFGGLEMLKFMNANESTLPLIFIGDNTSGANLKLAFNEGAFSYIAKPYEDISVLAFCMNGIHRKKSMTLIEMSVNYILYQFTDLDQYLKTQGKEWLFL